MDFTKMHGAGNDYIYVNAYQHDMDWPEVARKVSNRPVSYTHLRAHET